MVHKPKETDPFRDLTWKDLEEWAGRRVVSRGKSYQKSARVEGIARTPTNGLTAWVKGSRLYATRVEWVEGELASECSCPNWGNCKHAVAVVVEYLHHVRKGKDTPLVGHGDQRLEMLQGLGENRAGEAASTVSNHSSARGEKPEPEDLRHYLESKTKEQLLSVLRDLAVRHEAVRQELSDGMALAHGNARGMAASIRADIHFLSSQPGWMDQGARNGYTPDYSRVRDRMQALVKQGYADAVVAIGEELLEAGTAQVEKSHDEGETSAELSLCMDVAFQALMASSRSIPEQILWVIDAEQKDEFDLCTGASCFWARDYTPSDWSLVANRIADRLSSDESCDKLHDVSNSYHRDRLSDQCIKALERAERKEEIIPLCEREAERTGSYIRLTGLLVKANRLEEAERWIHKGISATNEKRSGIAGALRDYLREIREKQNDWEAVTAMRVEEFVALPSVETFKELKNPATKANMWQDVRAAALAYLETGKIAARGFLRSSPRSRPPKPAVQRRNAFPETHLLLDIAIFEKRPDDVLRWCEKIESEDRGLGTGTRLDAVARVLSARYPDRAVAIWKKLVESNIALTRPAAYDTAAACLANIRKVLEKSGKSAEWHDYLGSIRQANLRKRRLLEVLDGVATLKIIDTP